MNTRGLDLKPGVWILALLWLLIKCHNIMIEPFQPLSSDVYHPAAAPFGYLPRPEWPWGTEDQQLLCSVCLRHILIYIRYNPLKHGWSKFGSSGSSATSSIELKSFRSDQIACFNPSWIAGLQISFYNPLGCFFTTSDPAGQPAGSPYEVLTLLYTYPEGVQSGDICNCCKMHSQVNLLETMDLRAVGKKVHASPLALISKFWVSPQKS